MQDLSINFNGESYIAEYNEQSGYYEVNLEAPETGGIYQAEATFTDLFGQDYEDAKAIQILAKEEFKIESKRSFMWIFDSIDFSLKDVVEISEYEINIDEETNKNTTVNVLKDTNAKSDDIVAIKENNEVTFWGTIGEINNEDGSILHQYIIKYITNIFDTKVPLSKNMEEEEIEDGIYRIRSALDTKMVIDVNSGSLDNGANIQIYENNNTDAQKFAIEKHSGDYYTIKNIKSNKMLDVTNQVYNNGTNVQQYESNGANAQKWKIQHKQDAYYKIKTKGYDYYLDILNAVTTNGSNIQILSSEDCLGQQFILERLDEEIIKSVGIEDYIAKVITDNFINSDDILSNKDYLEVRVKTHTKIQASVTNVENNLYNLHTYMTNCTQLYNISYNFFIEDSKFIMEIENKAISKELIDVRAQAISNYTEVFETDIVSKVEVITDTKTYYLYLLNDRTTTTDMSNENRAKGRTERTYTSRIEDAEQVALDVIKSNKYNHMISFSMLNKQMKIGTPIAIKTKKSLIFDTYISAICKKSNSKMYDYICGNIRIKFIDKISKERNKR